MRTIGFIVGFLFLCFPPGQEGRSLYVLKGPFTVKAPVLSFPYNKPADPGIDTTRLKRDSWYHDAVRNITESEYHIIPAPDPMSYTGPNREQGLRAVFRPAVFELEPRTGNDWKLELRVKGIYAGRKKIYSPASAPGITYSGNRVRFDHGQEFSVEYVNNAEGVRQNFIIEKEPASKPGKVTVQLRVNDGWFMNRVHPREIHFARSGDGRLEKKLTYNDLKVWDACNRELPARFETAGDGFAIVVETKNAVYPITIDPLSTTAAWSGEGNQNSSSYGTSVMSAGDVNGDGYSDVIVGAYTYDNGQADEGRAFVYHGSATGLSATSSWTAEADQAGASFGTSVNTAGDVNGDGYSDVIVGALNYDNGNTDEGRAYLYLGSATGLSATAAWTYEPNQNSANLGTVASAGDVNGDGYSDVIVGARLMDNGQGDEGLVFIFHGSASGLSASPNRTYESDQGGAALGLAVSSAGDVNGDGYSDIIIGANIYTNTFSQEGRVWIYQGSASGLPASPALVLNGGQASANYGNAVGCAGDVNGDGYSDVVIAAPGFDNGQTNEGKADVHLGSASGVVAAPAWTTEGGTNNFFYGSGIHMTGGDFDGDGYSDLLVGCQSYTNGQTNEGISFMYRGSATGLGTTASWSVESNQAGAFFGTTAVSAGDVNGDGCTDAIVGASQYTNGNTGEGAAFVYHGSPDGLSASPVNTPDDADQADANFGVSVASAGDVNGDGYSDVIIGAWLYDDGGNINEGRAYVYHGSAAGLSATPNSTLDDADQAGCFFGETVAGAGDVNGDGYSDVIIGADNYDDAGNNNEGRAFVYHGSAGGVSAAPNWIGDDANQASAFFGVSLASAGDVNGDGYGDIIVGAIWYTDGGNTNEGRAFVYHGSITGLSLTPDSTPDDADQPNAQFGWSVAGAGDVNGDGYSDVIIGALTYDDAPFTDEGRVFVYHGSMAGLSASPDNTPDDANQAGAQFGESVAAAGDVNGDGYSDVVIGARLYDDAPNTDEGRAFVYHGSATGLNASPNSAPDDADQSGASFGISVASAGDVNGDGYSDVIIGARFYDDGANADEGRAFVYHGSSGGLSSAPANTPDDANETGAYFGYSVACAGDVNGDGYSDIIVGAHQSDDGTSNEGRAFLYYGNNAGGLRNNLRLYNTDLVTPIQRFNIAEGGLFGAGLYSRSSIGRIKGRLTWEVIRQGLPFSGVPITNSTAFLGKQSAWIDLGTSGTELKHLVQKPGFQNKIRTRVEYDKTTAITGQVYGPWRYPPGYLQGAHGMNSIPLPVRFVSFTAVKEYEQVRLQWITAEETTDLYYQVEYSTDGNRFHSLATVQGLGQPQNIYQWVHARPAKGPNYYRVMAIDGQVTKLTETRRVVFTNTLTTVIYPQPARPGDYITVLDAGIKTGTPVELALMNSHGQVVWEMKLVAVAEGILRLQVPLLASGMYWLKMRTGGRSAGSKLIVSGD